MSAHQGRPGLIDLFEAEGYFSSEPSLIHELNWTLTDTLGNDVNEFPNVDSD